MSHKNACKLFFYLSRQTDESSKLIFECVGGSFNAHKASSSSFFKYKLIEKNQLTPQKATTEKITASSWWARRCEGKHQKWREDEFANKGGAQAMPQA